MSASCHARPRTRWRALRRLPWLGVGLVVAGIGLRDAAADVSVPRDGHAADSHARDDHALDGCAGPSGAKRPGCAGVGVIKAAKPTAAFVCGETYGRGRVVSGVSDSGVQEALLGASASGATLLYLRGPSHACVGGPGYGTALLVADRVDDSGSAYTITDVTGLPAFARFTRREATMTVSPDGTGVIGAATSGDGFLVSIRSGSDGTDFGTPSAGPFATINAALPKPAWVGWPVLSADGLAFYYKIQDSGDSARDGIYESVRGSTSAAFPAGTRMPELVQKWGSVTGVAPDHLTLYVTRDFGTWQLTRASTSEPFAEHATGVSPTSAYRVSPVGGCRLIGTCEPGGCWREDICVWSATAK